VKEGGGQNKADRYYLLTECVKEEIACAAVCVCVCVCVCVLYYLYIKMSQKPV